jgi:hypothetical protein
MELIDIIGIGSAALTLTAFVGNEWGKLDTEGFAYDLMNFLAAIGLFAYAHDADVLPFMIVNAVWGLVSGADVVKHLLGRKGLKRRRK